MEAVVEAAVAVEARRPGKFDRHGRKSRRDFILEIGVKWFLDCFEGSGLQIGIQKAVTKYYA